jgi:iron complex transport system substrate-binding protein
VNGADLNPSIRTVDGVEKVSAALQEWGLAQ